MRSTASRTAFTHPEGSHLHRLAARLQLVHAAAGDPGRALPVLGRRAGRRPGVICTRYSSWPSRNLNARPSTSPRITSGIASTVIRAVTPRSAASAANAASRRSWSASCSSPSSPDSSSCASNAAARSSAVSWKIDPSALDDYADLAAFDVTVLAPERTLTEKMAFLHHRSTTGDLDELRRGGRHLYDVTMLLRSEREKRRPGCRGGVGPA